MLSSSKSELGKLISATYSPAYLPSSFSVCLGVWIDLVGWHKLHEMQIGVMMGGMTA